VQRFDGDGSAGVGEDGGSGVGTAHGEEYSEILVRPECARFDSSPRY
jgi:hypothetical protein